MVAATTEGLLMALNLLAGDADVRLSGRQVRSVLRQRTYTEPLDYCNTLLSHRLLSVL